MPTPPSQLALTSQCSTQYATAVHPKNGATKPTRPMRLASFHLIRKTAGSSSAPARNVSTMAPVPERNLIQESSVCRSAVPRVAPIISCATVPTTISESAVATRSQIDTRVATRARPSHRAARSQVSVMTLPPNVLANAPLPFGSASPRILPLIHRRPPPADRLHPHRSHRSVPEYTRRRDESFLD